MFVMVGLKDVGLPAGFIFAGGKSSGVAFFGSGGSGLVIALLVSTGVLLTFVGWVSFGFIL